MLIVRVLETDHKIWEAVVEYKFVFNITCLLQANKNIGRFTVVGSSGEKLMPADFGFGCMDKWEVTLFDNKEG